MAPRNGKTAREILGRYTAGDETFEGYETQRLARVRGLLSRVVSDLSFQEELCAELGMEKAGFPARSRYPRWARRLADVLRNSDGAYSAGVRRAVFGYAQNLHAEAGFAEGERRPLTELLVRESRVPVLSDIARELQAARG